ncbi:hypothetical protein V1478_006485 [Vespula squamosa]|uniref:Uncharacterized protein n=1 Tax=Vespula squamosa TaxID=30214 RepID=A0ABD2B8H7_VESSQ
MQQPPRGGTWVGNTCFTWKSYGLNLRGTDHRGIRILQRKGMSPFFRTRMIGKTLTRVTAGTRLGVSGASLSPTEDCVLILISKYRHDRSCLEMSEADGMDGGAFLTKILLPILHAANLTLIEIEFFNYYDSIQSQLVHHSTA